MKPEIHTQQPEGPPPGVVPRALRRHAWLVVLGGAATTAASVVLSFVVDPHRPIYEIAQPPWQYALAGLALGLLGVALGTGTLRPGRRRPAASLAA